jgi:CRP-like cAMP-binding protein
MSLLTRAPRVASLIADGPARTLRIGDRAFASMLQERPSVALELLRVLARRLSDATSAAED